MAERASIILAQLEGLRADAAAAAEQHSTTLRIGVLSSVNARIMPSLLREFAAAHPDVRVRVLEGSDPEVLDWLRTGAVDVGVAAERFDDLLTSPLASDELLAVVPVDHPLATQSAVPLAALGQEPFIMPAGGCAPIISGLARAAGVRLRRHYEVRDTVSITSMVRERLGVTIMPELSIPDDRSGLRVLPLDRRPARAEPRRASRRRAAARRARAHASRRGSCRARTCALITPTTSQIAASNQSTTIPAATQIFQVKPSRTGRPAVIAAPVDDEQRESADDDDRGQKPPPLHG